MNVVRKVTVAKAAGGPLSFVMSDATIDRYGDTIDAAGWSLASFTANPIALFNHNANFPIGSWANVRVEGGRLIGDLSLAAKGTSERIDELIGLVEQGILRAVSVGFQPIEREPLGKGIKFKKQELLETSLVSVPANPSAVQLARSFGASDETLAMVFGESADRDPRAVHRTHGENAATAEILPRSKPMQEPLSRRIEFAQARLSALRDDWDSLVTDGGDTPDESNLIAREEKGREISLAQRALDSLEDGERLLASRSVPAVPAATGTEVQHRPGSDPIVLRRPFAQPVEKIRDGEYFMRSLVATVVARARGWRPNLDSPAPFYQALAERYGQDGRVDERTRAIAEVACRAESEAFAPGEVFSRSFVPAIQRAATAPATTTTSGWASQLVSIGYADFLDILLPASVFPGLAARSMRLTFGRNGTISIPNRLATPTIAGSFVPEGGAIPVRQAAVGSQTFTPKKIGVISAFTREIAEHSTPAIEGLIKQWMQEDSSVSLDSVLLDATVASTTRPAGIRAGVSVTTATAGGGFAALVGDIKALTGALLTATNGNLRKPVWLMNPTQALSLTLTQNAGGDFPFAAEVNQQRFTGYPMIVSGNVTAGMVILLDAADFAVIEAGAPRFDVSDQAVLVFDDTSPAQIGTTGAPNVVGAPARSLWQTDSLAIRMLLDVNWGFVRTGAISWTQAVTW